MKDRIKLLRKKEKMSQEEFGRKIGIGKSSVSKIELGENNPSDQTIMLICSIFNVNEVWLRTGEGGEENMYSKMSEDDRFSINLGNLGRTENQLERNMLNAIAEASPEKLKHIEEFMKACLGIED